VKSPPSKHHFAVRFLDFYILLKRERDKVLILGKLAVVSSVSEPEKIGAPLAYLNSKNMPDKAIRPPPPQLQNVGWLNIKKLGDEVTSKICVLKHNISNSMSCELLTWHQA
jgi:hypothetical protein